MRRGPRHHITNANARGWGSPPRPRRISIMPEVRVVPVSGRVQAACRRWRAPMTELLLLPRARRLGLLLATLTLALSGCDAKPDAPAPAGPAKAPASAPATGRGGLFTEVTAAVGLKETRDPWPDG